MMKIARLVIWLIITLLLIFIALWMAMGEARADLPDVSFPAENWGIVMVGRYKNAHLYTAGDAEIREAVHNIDIHWTIGSVNVIGYEGDTVRAYEKTPNETTDLRLHWYCADGTLYIQPCAAKRTLKSLSWGEKALTVEVPYSLLSSFQQLTIDSTSATLSLNGLTANKMVIESTSGDVSIMDSTAAEICIESTSGNITMNETTAADLEIDCTSGDVSLQSLTAAALEIETTSGNVTLIDVQSSDLSVDTGSGDITGNSIVTRTLALDTTSGNALLDGSFEQIEAKSTSGDIQLATNTALSTLNVDTTSGNVTVRCPQGNGFTLKASSTSGDFESEHALTQQGKTRICGNGESLFEIHTTSGDIRLLKQDTVAD